MKKPRRRPPSRIPSATYRLQLNEKFPLRDAIALVPYLDSLGISDLYLSPVLMARPGSVHCYDVTDHSLINPELGTMQDLEALSAELERRGMSIILDVVPNHMCVAHPSNKWWWDVLENGPSSAYASYFDIDWNPPKAELANKVLLPVLGDQYGKVLEAGQLRVAYSAGAFTVSYYETAYPAAPASWRFILEPALMRLRERAGDSEDPRITELESILTALSYLPSRTEADPDRQRERYREKEVIKRRLSDLTGNYPEVQACIDDSINRINGREGEPNSFDRLDEMLADQPYRLSYWRVAADEINYRRFFDINDLGAIRVEDPPVFQAVHAVVMDLIRRGIVKGLRVDHPDGLFEPARYFEELQQAAAAATGADAESPPLFVTAEKILIGAEELRPWAIEGTTGYGFLNQLNGVFVDPDRRDTFLRLYRAVAEPPAASFVPLLEECKRLILRFSMSSELNVLARRLDRISEQHRWYRDFTLENLRDALAEVITCFPVYRTYATPSYPADAEDVRHIDTAIAIARKRNPSTSASVFEFIRSLMVFEYPPGLSEDQIAECQTFAMKLQQITGQVMAKGLEDTAHYRYFPLASLNEVGGEPVVWGVRDSEFHIKAKIRQRDWPHALVATSTHDTKRGEDVRARLNVLSEIPVEWFEAVRRWSAMNAPHRTRLAGTVVPGANEEYLLYQTLVGTWPVTAMDESARADFAGRIHLYMEKAIREAKLNTSWINPSQTYEGLVRRFVEHLLDPAQSAEFQRDFAEFVERVSRAGLFNSLSQVVLKTASPGVPDFYQGSELVELNLVDPDNRRPVDYVRRRELLREYASAIDRAPGDLVRQALTDPYGGCVKMLVTSRLLQFRRLHHAVFSEGSYAPLRIRGPRKKHCVAFARMLNGRAVIAAAGRFFHTLLPLGDPPVASVWGDTSVVLHRLIKPGRYRDVISGRAVVIKAANGKHELPLAELFSDLPVAVLSGDEVA